MASSMTFKPLAMRQSSSLSTKVQRRLSTVRTSRVATRQTTKALSEVNLAIGGSTVALLALGRFVFLPYHRRSLEKAGPGVQNGQTHAEAGDKFAQEATLALKTNDPAGFTIVDTAAWGALGHAVGYSLLAINSLDYFPKF